MRAGREGLKNPQNLVTEWRLRKRKGHPFVRLADEMDGKALAAGAKTSLSADDTIIRGSQAQESRKKPRPLRQREPVKGHSVCSTFYSSATAQQRHSGIWWKLGGTWPFWCILHTNDASRGGAVMLLPSSPVMPIRAEWRRHHHQHSLKTNSPSQLTLLPPCWTQFLSLALHPSPSSLPASEPSRGGWRVKHSGRPGNCGLLTVRPEPQHNSKKTQMKQKWRKTAM